MATIIVPPTQQEQNSDAARRRAAQDRTDLQALSDAIASVSTVAGLRTILRDLLILVMRLAHRVAALEAKEK